MSEYYPVIVVGGGQAGLSASYYLKEYGIDHTVIDKGKIGDTWRLKRWDSFCLVTKNWQCNLPGFPYDGDDPEGFMHREDIVRYIERFADSFSPPIKTEVSVDKINFSEQDSKFSLETSVGIHTADNVIIATGTYQKSRIPTCSRNLSPEITQIHSIDYKNPGLLPGGGVLVVGSAQSGCQIAEDLKLSGQKVYLSVGSAPRISRTYRGKDILEWIDLMGMYELPVEQHKEGKSIRFKAHAHISGRYGGYTINLRQMALDGVQLLGRLEDINGTTVRFRDDLTENLENADKADADMKKAIDEFIEKNGMDTVVKSDSLPEWDPDKYTSEIDLAAENINTVIWATGYEYDFSWIDIPVFDDRGYPEYERGITNIPGLYFVGLHWLHTWGSGLFYSVGRDAKYIVEHLVNGQED